MNTLKLKSLLITFIIIIALCFAGCSQQNITLPNTSVPHFSTSNIEVTTTAAVPSTQAISRLEQWGLGKTETEHISQNRSYEWYIDQWNTGYASGNNCGPSCAVMAAKWFDEDFQKTVEDARDTFPNDGGWWYINNIYDFLTDNDIPCALKSNISLSSIKSEIKDGNILIFNINTEDIPYNYEEEQHTGKPYIGDFGHFIIVKGYRVVDDTTFFEVYDPYGFDAKYSDGTLKCKDRYYLADEVINSASGWCPEYLAILPKD
ncbi:MAG: C39 family peptidase [Oscillospiraceae bacterium]|jgi:hypothetical protein|nr:C39 family peptidase [Oscillospiraceae bacterium]